MSDERNYKPYQIVLISCLRDEMADLTLHAQRLRLQRLLSLLGPVVSQVLRHNTTQSVLHSLQMVGSHVPSRLGLGPVHQRVVHEGPQDGHNEVLLSPHHTQANLTGQSEWTLNTDRTEGVDLVNIFQSD